jgi:ferric-dicitrate binding protein FerR (iron transport regulator)
VAFEDLRKNNFILSVSTDTEVVSRSGYGLLSATVNTNLNFSSWLTGVYAFEEEPMKSVFSLVNKGNDFALPALSSQWGHRRISGVFEFDGSPKALKTFISELSRKSSSQSRKQL